MHSWILALLVLLFFIALLSQWSIYRAIRLQATRDEARPANAIVVFGAAEYNGIPSPVFEGRLDHAFDLEERRLAPLLITTGGHGGDRQFTEAGVGRDYLVQKGAPADKILTDPRSETTLESVEAVTRLLRARGAKSCIAVSDGFHLYRIKMMFHAEGITAYASPVPNSSIESDPVERTLYSLREMIAVTLWRLGVRV